MPAPYLNLIPNDEMARYESKQLTDEWDQAEKPFNEADAFNQDWSTTMAGLENQPSVDLSQEPQLPAATSLPTKEEDVTKPDLLAPTGEPPEKPPPTVWDQLREKSTEAFKQTVPTIDPNDSLLEQVGKASQRNYVTPGGILRPDIAQGPINPESEGAVGLDEVLAAASEKTGLFRPTNAYEQALNKAIASAPPSIRGSLEAANKAAPELGGDIRNLPAIVERAIADRMSPVNKVSPGVESEFSALLGRHGAAVDRTIEEFAPALQMAGEDAPYLNQLMGLQKYLDASAAKANPSRFSAFAKSDADAMAQLADMEAHLGPDRWANLQRANALRQGTQDKILQDTVDAGLIPQELADRLREEYPNFSPTVVTRFVEEEGVRGTGQNLSQRWNTLRKLTEEGSPDDQLPPMQATFKAAIERHIAIQKNHALQTLARDGGFVVTPVRQGQQATGVVFRDEGKLVQMAVPKDIKSAVEGFDNEQLSGLGAFMSALNAPLRAGATKYNPTFLAANAVADYFQGYVREGLLPPDVVRGYEGSLNRSALYHVMIQSGAGTGAEGSYMQRGIGATTSIRPQNLLKGESPFVTTSGVMKGLGQMEKDIVNSGGIVVGSSDFKKLLNALEQKDVGALAKYFGSLGPIQTVGAAIEQGPRLATFAKHLEPEFERAMGRKAANWDELAAWAKTQPPEVTAPAAMAARRVTVDFSRIGQYMRTMNALVPFLNAQIQGGLTVGRSLRDIPLARARLAGLMTVGASLSLWNQTMFPDEYADVPSYIKQGSLVVMMPGSVKNDNGLGYKKLNFVALPVRSWGAFTTAVDEAMQAAKGTSPGLFQAVANIANASNPIPGEPFGASVPQGTVNWGDPINALKNVGYSAGNLLPTPLKVPLELATNTNFYTHSPIEPEAESKGNLYTPELQQKQNTTLLAKVIGEKTGASPIGIDFLINGVLAGGGTTASQGISTLMGQESDRPLLVGGLLRTIYRNYGGAVEQKAYDDRDAEFHRIAGENKQLFESFKKSDVPLGNPPTKIESIFLLPAEQAAYQKEKIGYLAGIVPDLNELLSELPVESRKEILQEQVGAANDYAAEQILGTLSVDEIIKRLELLAENPINPSHRAVEEEWTPVPSR